MHFTMSPMDIAYGAIVGKPLLQLMCEAFMGLVEVTNTIKNDVFAELLQNDNISAQLYAYINSLGPAQEGTAPYYIRRGLLLLDSYSNHQILEICKDIDRRGIAICCQIFSEDFASGILGVTGEIDPRSVNYIEIIIRKEIFYIKSFHSTL